MNPDDHTQKPLALERRNSKTLKRALRTLNPKLTVTSMQCWKRADFKGHKHDSLGAPEQTIVRRKSHSPGPKIFSYPRWLYPTATKGPKPSQPHT